MKYAVGIVTGWILMLVCMYSMPVFTGHGTGSVLLTLTSWLPVEINIDLLNIIVRKSTHFILYGALAVLLWRVLRKVKYAKQLAWMIATGCGVFDELCQSFIPSRTGVWYDVVIDSTGAFLFLLLASAIWNRKGKNAHAKEEGYV
ncbi:VanZ family protein [Aureibacillus halotolerans]|uniref:VanZ like protein n=1 Tax=Aureibacillus halotolerans TaxID=1508390 RepID=A0A4R6UAB3_9BACI|nr:VanZ family protein [Aureibacillus halotolerans]TDQ42786.1 VanZ like protein [Aureibacillus halotolerans]